MFPPSRIVLLTVFLFFGCGVVVFFCFVFVLLPLVCVLCFFGRGDDVKFCTDLDPQPPDCELCNNGRDDDLDGDVDCDDSFCEDAAVCKDKLASKPVTPPVEESDSADELTNAAAQ